ncbi:hypothetical protein, partial [Bacteroides salyersiae]|uniref:hypothetical protein n=1 Tax=Bacteroides salyersiae TaxID=291644 RepID=UPI00221FC576
HNFLHFAKLLNKKYGTHTESRILHLHKIFYSAYERYTPNLVAINTLSRMGAKASLTLPFSLPTQLIDISTHRVH